MIFLLTTLVGGCASLGYYGQSIGGQLEILNKQRPINEVIDDPATSDDLKGRLDRILRMREFASREMHLPDNDSYRWYVDLDRPFVVWNVYAAPELSLKPVEWCFPFVGCVAYRGYFANYRALAYADELQQQGFDVHIGGVAAYSTLGWFHDPMLSTLIHRDDGDLAGVMFHELAHQLLYVRGDSAFNESFATVVELEGARRWLAAYGTPADLASYLANKRAQTRFVELIQRYRGRLAEMYASPLPDDEKRAAKSALFGNLRTDFDRLKAEDPGLTVYEHWFARGMNNARLVPFAIYHQHVPAFQRLLAEADGDLRKFYRSVSRLSDMPKEQRDRELISIQAAD